jgi:predicted phosphodiesterase
MQGIHEKLKSFALANKKFVLLINKTLTIDNYTLIGSPLWSDIQEKNQKFVEKNMNDYNYIYIWNEETKNAERLRANVITQIFQHNVNYIKRQIKKCYSLGQKAIILTHHKPYLSPTYKADNTVDSAYESDLQNLFVDTVVLWAYGHTHMADNKKINNTILYSNPKGYPREKTFFKSADFVTI